MKRTGVIVAIALTAASCSSAGTAAPPNRGPTDPAITTPVTTTALTTTAATPPVPSQSSAVSSATTTEPGCDAMPSRSRTTQHRNTERSYRVAAPAEIVPNTPLVVLLHGFSSNPERILGHSRLSVEGPEAGVVVVAPMATGDPTSWEIVPPADPDDSAYDGPDDLGFLRQLVTDLKRDNPCLGDVWVAGLSAGSAMAAVYLCSEPDHLVGVGLVAALVPAVCPASVVRRMYIFHGTDDVVVSYTGGAQPVADESFTLPGIESSVVDWAALGDCSEPWQQTLGSDVEIRGYGQCRSGVEVVLHTYLGGNHNWPGGIDGQLPPVIDTLPASCVLLHHITNASGDVYDVCAASGTAG